MADFPLDSHQDAKVSIDEQERQAKGSLQYLLENRPMIPITRHNTLTFKICGEEGFALIAKDLWEAKGSADIICWGFDPGMELDRTGDTWPRGMRYGNLLELIASRDDPVKVRLLVWCDSNAIVYKQANNIPGYTDHSDYYSMSSDYDGKDRQDYCVEWWKNNLPGGKNLAGKNKNLQVAFREVTKADALALLAMTGPTLTEQVEDDRGFQEEKGFEYTGSHHQKPILIDYDYDEGSKAIGYVMGLNSVTDYWDRMAHEVDDPLREWWSSDQLKGETEHQTAAEGKASSSVYKHIKPYQDYACRIQGPALKQLKYNFERAWAATIGQPLPYEDVMPAEWAKTVKAEGNPAHLVQIVRTQAHERDKSIKELYFQASSHAYNYIYIENQYFIYPQFVRNLKTHRKTFADEWAAKSKQPISEMPRLYIFIVIPHPERDDMTPRTYDMLSELGHGQTVGGTNEMPGQAALMDKGKDDWKYPDSVQKGRSTWVLDRPSVEDLEKTHGIDVTIARLRTSGPDANSNMAYREIYIHSKLMIIDDAFITVGSANMSQRSMSVDSEINIAATGTLYAKDLRERVFELLSGGKVNYSGDPKDTADAFGSWQYVMANNKNQRKSKQPMSGFLLQFEEHRSTTSMQASIDVPTSNDTAFG
ncbi:phospholipase D-like domain-containing protein [Paraburkholderia megapolitana]|uniref:phospholipase D-like domain-containing protein n=1 Tax=Paraburkholderia megapolitana TaxID=420953 RepID=UPI0038B74221